MDQFFLFLGMGVSALGGVLILLVLGWAVIDKILRVTGAAKALLAAYARILDEKRNKDPGTPATPKKG